MCGSCVSRAMHASDGGQKAGISDVSVKGDVSANGRCFCLLCTLIRIVSFGFASLYYKRMEQAVQSRFLAFWTRKTALWLVHILGFYGSSEGTIYVDMLTSLRGRCCSHWSAIMVSPRISHVLVLVNGVCAICNGDIQPVA